MKRTDEFVPDKKPLLQVETKVRAFALSCIDLSLIVDYQNGILGLWPNQDLSDLTLDKVIFSLKDLDFLVEDFRGGEPGGEGEPEDTETNSGKLRFVMEDGGGSHARE